MKQLSNINTKYLMFWWRGNIKNLIFTRSLHCCCSCTGFVRDIDYCLARPIHLEKTKNSNTNIVVTAVCFHVESYFGPMCSKCFKLYMPALIAKHNQACKDGPRASHKSQQGGSVEGQPQLWAHLYCNAGPGNWYFKDKTMVLKAIQVQMQNQCHAYAMVLQN